MVVEIPLSKTGKHAGKYVAIISDEDAILTEFNWSVKSGNYAHRRYGGKTIELHRAVMERILGHSLKKGEQVDHIDNNPLNNRRENLRVTTQLYNKKNKTKPTNNTSGFKGVSFRKDTGRYAAYITHNGKRIHLGFFLTKEDAYKARRDAATKLHGEFANLN